jgi:hypothetical protein
VLSLVHASPSAVVAPTLGTFGHQMHAGCHDRVIYRYSRFGVRAPRWLPARANGPLRLVIVPADGSGWRAWTANRNAHAVSSRVLSGRHDLCMRLAETEPEPYSNFRLALIAFLQVTEQRPGLLDDDKIRSRSFGRLLVRIQSEEQNPWSVAKRRCC